MITARNPHIEYVDHSITTRRNWTRAREIHRKKLEAINKSPLKKTLNLNITFFSESRSRKRNNGKRYSDENRIKRENNVMIEKISEMSPRIDVIFEVDPD